MDEAPDHEPLLVFDIGAHLGADTAYYLSRGFRVVAVEANPELARRLTALDRSGRLCVEARALSDSHAAVALHVPIDGRADCWATTSNEQADMLAKAKVRTRTIEVNTVSLDTLVERYGTPYYIKCDIEGSDALFLEMLARLDRKPATVSVELTQLSLSALLQQLKLIHSCGYKRFVIRDQGRLPSAAFAAGRVHRIEGMWSGPFGVEIDDGGALSWRQARRSAIAIALRSRLFGEFGIAGRLRLYGLVRRLARVPLFRPLLYTSWYDIHCFAEDEVTQ
jgi:FkbM family methyltransferase